MENIEPVRKDQVVAVAVNKGKSSQAALKWTVDNLLPRSLTLVHVRQKAEAIQSDVYSWSHGGLALGELQSVNKDYKETMERRAKEMLLPFQSYCKAKKIESDLVILEENDVEKGLEDFVLENQIDVLVLGAGSRGGIFKMKGPDVATRLAANIPYFCTMYTTAKGKLLSVKAAQTVPSKEMDIQGPENSIPGHSLNAQLTCDRSLGSSRTLLSERDPVRDFEFRSPIEKLGRSDFEFGGFSEADTDISFVSSDKDFFERTSYSMSTDREGQSVGSFMTSHSNLSTRNSETPDASDPVMDELRRLRLELQRTKNMCDYALHEAHDAKVMAIERNGQRTNKVHGF